MVACRAPVPVHRASETGGRGTLVNRKPLRLVVWLVLENGVHFGGSGMGLRHVSSSVFLLNLCGVLVSGEPPSAEM